MWKWIVALFIICVVMCGGGVSFLAFTGAGKNVLASLKPEDKKTEVRIEKVKRGDLVKVVSAPGSIEPKTKIEISAQVSAKIIALPFRERDQVKKGDVVCRLDSDDYAAALESARASLRGEEARLAGLRADLKLAEAEWGRTKELFDSKDVSKSDLDAATATLDRAKANVQGSEHAIEVAQAAIDRAQKSLDYCTIRSPIDGVVTILNNEVGEQVLGTSFNAGTVIMEIADLNTMLMKAHVDEANIGPVRAGQQAAITINAYPNRTFRGVVELVGLKREVEKDGTGYFEAQVLVNQSDSEPTGPAPSSTAPANAPTIDLLQSGLTANVDIQVQTFHDVLKVPSQAVVDRRIDELPKDATDKNPNVDRTKVFARVVYKYVDGQAKSSAVSIGASDVTHTVILSGLNEGDTIISGPFKVLVTLKDEQKVVDEEEAKKAREAKGEKPKPLAAAGGEGGKS